MAPLLPPAWPDTAALEAAFAFVLRATAQASVVVLVILNARLLLRRRLSPRARYALWGLLALPILAPLLPAVRVPLPDFTHPRAAPAPVDPAPATPAQVVTRSPNWRVEYGPVPSAAPPVARPEPTNWLRLAGITWLTGAGVLLVRLLVTHARAVWLARRAEPLTDPTLLALLDACRQTVRTRRTPRLVAAPPGAGPALLGFLRPCLMLPPDAPQRLSESELRFVLLHELVHLKRADALAEWLLALFQVVHWFNPLVLFAAARCRADREIACDAAVVALAGESRRADYGRTILRLATELAAEFSPRRFPPVALGILETRSPLERRLRMLAAAPSSRASRWAAPLVALVSLSLVACTNTPQPATDSQSARSQSAADDEKTSVARKSDGLDSAAGPDTRPSVLDVPNEWPDIYSSGDRTVAEERDDPKNAAVRARLDRVLPEVNFEAVPFTDVIDRFRDVSGANLFVNWRALENAGVERKAPVTARLRDIRFAKALTVVLDSVSGGTVPLGYTVDDGVITITTGEDLDRNTITRVYDIRDLIIPIPDFDMPPANEQPVKPKAEEPGAAARAKIETDDAAMRTRQEMIDELARLITETVSPQSWRDAGGSVGSVRELQGQMIITQTPESHDQIVKLLQQFRDARGVQIVVETRLIAVDDALLAALPAGLRDKVAGQVRATKEPVTPDRAAPDPADVEGPDNTPPEKDGAAGVFLSVAEVDAILRATQAGANSGVISAPRVTLFNGQAAYVLVCTQRSYVADYTVDKQPDGGTKYEAVMGQATSGIMLWARATASADRKHATLSLHPRFSQLTGLNSVPWHQQPAAGAEKLEVQRPDVLVSELRCTTTIPDRQTLLLGGLKGTFAEDWDRMPAREALRNVIVLVKPTVIVQREVEMRAREPMKQKKSGGR